MNDEEPGYHRIVPARPSPMSKKHFAYMTYTENLRPIKNTPWQSCHGASLEDVRKQTGQDLVSWPGHPDMVFLPSEITAAEERAVLLDGKEEDLIVSLVVRAVFSNPMGVVRVESLRHSELDGRVAEMKSIAKNSNGSCLVMCAYSEETGQLFWWNDANLRNEPRLPKYGQEYEKRIYRGAGL
jgi:hypothetical protein